MPGDPLHIVDGSMDFSGGVDSSKVTTIQSEANPNGLARNELAWLVNGTLRDGAILTRTGQKYLKTILPTGNLWQGGIVYEPANADPYLLASITGRIYQIPLSAAPDVDLSAAFALVNPATLPQAFFCNAEQFTLIQAGDYATLPLFWDGATLRRSIGITNPAVAAGTPGVNEIPAAGPMDYYQNRLWYANGRTYSAGDIVQGASGTVAYNRRDAILNVTENPLAVGGDGFVVPENAGTIRALKHPAIIDTNLGQGQLVIFTQKSIYTLDVPLTRTAWIAAGAASAAGPINQPQQKVVQMTNGAVGDRSIVSISGDLFYQSLEPSIRSYITALRYYYTWGNTPISGNLERLLAYEDRALMHLYSGIEFGNRVLMAMRGVQTAAGVACQAIVPLDFLPVASFGKKLAPCWEGHWEGIKILQLFSTVFGGLQRAFAVVVSDLDGSIQLWELTDYLRENVSQSGSVRTTMIIDFPAFNWGDPFALKKLVSAELWLDKLLGTVDFKMEYRPDSDVCWYFWDQWQMCSQESVCDDPNSPDCYVSTPFRESHVTTMTLVKPPQQCQTPMGRPAYHLHQCQCRLTIKGWVRVRGILLYAEPMDQKLYHNVACGRVKTSGAPMP